MAVEIVHVTYQQHVFGVHVANQRPTFGECVQS